MFGSKRSSQGAQFSTKFRTDRIGWRDVSKMTGFFLMARSITIFNSSRNAITQNGPRMGSITIPSRDCGHGAVLEVVAAFSGQVQSLLAKAQFPQTEKASLHFWCLLRHVIHPILVLRPLLLDFRGVFLVFLELGSACSTSRVLEFPPQWIAQILQGGPRRDTEAQNAVRGFGKRQPRSGKKMKVSLQHTMKRG